MLLGWSPTPFMRMAIDFVTSEFTDVLVDRRTNLLEVVSRILRGLTLGMQSNNSIMPGVFGKIIYADIPAVKFLYSTLCVRMTYLTQFYFEILGINWLIERGHKIISR